MKIKTKKIIYKMCGKATGRKISTVTNIGKKPGKWMAAAGQLIFETLLYHCHGVTYG
jgi:hypothetical protein